MKGKNDAWQLGAKREISFQVIGYSEQALTQKVQVINRIFFFLKKTKQLKYFFLLFEKKVFLVNEACRHNVYLDSPIALQSIKNRYNGYSLEEYGHLVSFLEFFLITKIEFFFFFLDGWCC